MWKSGQKGQEKRRESRKTGATDGLKESARQGFAAKCGVQSPARNKYNRNPRLTSRVDLLSRETPSIDRRRYGESASRSRRGRQDERDSAAGGGLPPSPWSRSPTLARQLSVGRLEDPLVNARDETRRIDSDGDGDDDDDDETVLQGTHRSDRTRRGARRTLRRRWPWGVRGSRAHHRERTEQCSRSGTVAVRAATQRRSSARRGGSIPTDRRPCYHPPRALLRRCRRPRPSPPPRTPSPRPFLANHPSLRFLSPSPSRAPCPPALLPRNLRRCTRRPPLPITTASARARYLGRLTSRTYVPCLSHR